MKKILPAITVILLALAILSGCTKPQAELPIDTEPSASQAEPITIPTVENTPAITEDDMEQEGDASSDFVDTSYTQQIERYYTAISEQWDESTYFDHEMSALAAYYYEGDALGNIGFTLMDMDGDNVRELIIGAIKNSERDPLVFEIWTLKNGEPVMLAQSGSHNRYYMQYAEENDIWSVAYEAENGAANHAVYYLQLAEGNFEVIQSIIFDAVDNENEPWFMAYDLDWDISNDIPIDEDTANAIMEAGRNSYSAIEYFPYSRYK